MSAGDGGGLTARDLIVRGQQYRNFDPDDVRAVIEGQGIEEAREVLRFIESGRFDLFLEAVSGFFTKLDRDERDTFTQRNPDVVQWMSVWNEAHGFNPLDQWVTLAAATLTADRDERTAPPEPFVRRQLAHDTLLEDMAFRRRSYRNWTPGEFADIIEGGPYGLSEGMAVTELGLIDPVDAEGVDFPVEFGGKTVARALFGRIEAGRFRPILRAGLKAAGGFFGPLDPDERRLFTRRNPGLVDWLSAWGFADDLIHGAEMFPFSDVQPPLVAEMNPDTGDPNGCEAMPAAIREVLDQWDRDPCRINMGECAIFADAIADRVPTATTINNLEFAAQLGDKPEHVFLEWGGRFYDSEAPDGVDDFRDLPFFWRHFTEDDLEGAFIARPDVGEPEVAKAGVHVPHGVEPPDPLDDLDFDFDDLPPAAQGLIAFARQSAERSALLDTEER